MQAIICVLALLAIGCGPAEPTPALPPVSPPTIAAQSAVKATPPVQPDPNTAQIIYLRGDYGAPGEIVAAGADGGEPRVLAVLPSFNSATNGLDVDAASGAFVYTADLAGSLWSGALADRPQKITDGAGGWHVRSPRISPDGRTVAYAVHRERSAPSEPQPPPSEVWLVGIDGRGGRKLAEDTQRLISFPFGLSPIGWSGDGSKIYLLATAESEYIPTGPYQVDVATGAIERAPMPDEPAWSLALSPDGNYLAYSTWAIDPDELVLPVPPYRLRVTDLRTGNTITVLESGEQLYGPIVWSPEGKRLLVGVEEAWPQDGGDKPEEPSRFIGVDIGTRQTWEPAAWLEDLPVDLTPQLWLPGERVVLVDGAGALVVLDLDDERWVELELDEAPEVVVMGYMVPEGGESPDVDRMVESSDSHGQLSTSPDGQWRARLLVSDPADGGAWHRSQLRVERVDGSAGWTAIDEYIPHAICGDDMETLGWSATGDYLFGRPGCGDGCFRFAGAYDVHRLNIEDGSIEPAIAGRDVTLSPDRGRLASYTHDDQQIVVSVKELATGREVSAVIASNRTLARARTGIDGPVWSPDGRHLAIVETFGFCPDEDASTVSIIESTAMTLVHQEYIDQPPMAIDAWLDASHLRLTSLHGSDREPVTHVIEITGSP